MRQRVITAVVALALFLPLIYFDFGGVSVELLGAALAAVGVYELFRMKGLAILSFEGVLSALGAIILVLPQDPWFSFLPEKTDKFMLYYLIVMLLLGVSVISKNTYTIDETGFPVIVSLYVGMGFQSFVNARLESLVVLVFGLFVVWATDIGAYMVGRKYGSRKLWPEISPNKTVEGAAGGNRSGGFDQRAACGDEGCQQPTQGARSAHAFARHGLYCRAVHGLCRGCRCRVPPPFGAWAAARPGLESGQIP